MKHGYLWLASTDQVPNSRGWKLRREPLVGGALGARLLPPKDRLDEEYCEKA